MSCSECGLNGPFKDTDAEAIAAWNDRSPSELERLAREVAIEYEIVRLSAHNRKAFYEDMPSLEQLLDALAAFLGPSQKGKV